MLPRLQSEVFRRLVASLGPHRLFRRLQNIRGINSQFLLATGTLDKVPFASYSAFTARTRFPEHRVLNAALACDMARCGRNPSLFG